MDIHTDDDEVSEIRVYDTDLSPESVTLEIVFRAGGHVRVYFDSFRALRDHLVAAIDGFEPLVNRVGE